MKQKIDSSCIGLECRVNGFILHQSSNPPFNPDFPFTIVGMNHGYVLLRVGGENNVWQVIPDLIIINQ